MHVAILAVVLDSVFNDCKDCLLHKEHCITL